MFIIVSVFIVIFRKFKGGDVFALFPQEPATLDGWLCVSYMHVGQHSAASPRVVDKTAAATENEYRKLLYELQGIGYNDLKVCKRFSSKDYQIRQETARL